MRAHGWTPATVLFSAALLVTIVVYRETAASLLRVWSGSDTFAHCYLIVPICAFLAWRRRDELAALAPRPCLPALALLPALGFLWLLGRATDTLLVEQFSLVATIPVLVWAFFGTAAARLLAFPLGFLLFAVPFGDVLTPSLMRFTADFAVRALQLSGLPVAREGLYLSTPAGEWRVAEACSGLRFLVSGFALGCLFAHLMYRTAWKRLLFVALSFIVPIVANGLRAYILVMVGTVSEMRLERGLNHYTYGWIVFTVVMGVFFTVGAAFREHAPPKPGPAGPGEGRSERVPSAGLGRWIAALAIVAVAIPFWPGYFALQSGPRPESRPISLPQPQGGWALQEIPSPRWRPAFRGAASEAIGGYVNGGASVQCFVAFYDRQRQGMELIQHRNVVVDPDNPLWRNFGERDRELRWNGERLVVRETDIRSVGTRLLVWHWYWLPDEFTASPGWAKVLRARASLLLHRDQAAVVVLSASAADDREAVAQLRHFVQDMFPSIRSSLRRS
jgi:exosortase A